MPRFRKKPVEIEARQFDPSIDYDHACDVVSWCGGRATDQGLVIPTMEGEHLARPGYYVIKGVQGEFYGCEPDIFAATYEPVT